MHILLSSLTPFCKRLARVAAVIAVMAVLLLPQGVFAAEQCTCFCGTKQKGAKETTPALMADGAACANACAKKSEYFVGCFTNEAYFPRENDQCWTDAECAAWTSDSSPGARPTWSGQHFSCAEGYGHCFAAQRATKLNVPILGKTEVYGFGEYLDTAYRFLLGAAAVAAVLMITLAGFKYTTARGNSKDVQAAKDRIRDVIIGLLLLFSAVSIARLIDPRLIAFDVVKVPMTKVAKIVPGSSFCEDLRGYGYTVSGSGVSCGEKGEITALPTEGNVVSKSLKVGSPCVFKGTDCAENQVCIAFAGGDYQCSACNEVPSSAAYASTCKMIGELLKGDDIDNDHKYICAVNDTPTFDACVLVATNSKPYIDCVTVRNDAQTLTDKCNVYSKVPFAMSYAADQVCGGDICGVSRSGCQIQDLTIGSACVTK